LGPWTRVWIQIWISIKKKPESGSAVLRSRIVKYCHSVFIFYVLFFSPEDFLVWKKVQQHLENMSSQASLGKNKWDLVSSYVDSVKVSRHLFVPPTISPDPELFPLSRVVDPDLFLDS
jgi:hypothetical protein